MPQAPKVSIIVPCYNNERYLPQCLDSALNQTLPDFEVICINDGSKDGSLDIMKQYQARDGRIKIIDKPNSGYGHSMNRGLEAAQGEYIAILESDDAITHTMLEELYALAEENRLDFIKADFNAFFGEGESRTNEYKTTCFSDPEMYNKVLDPRVDFEVFNADLVTWTGIYRRSFIEEHHIRYHETPGAAYQDNGFWFQTFTFARRMMFVPRAYYQYRQDNPNSSINSNEKVYCMHEEHIFMHNFLDNHPEFPRRFYRAWAKKMYQNYNFTYSKIADRFKDEFLACCQEDFKLAFSRGEFDIADFHEEEWAVLNDVTDDAHLSYLKFENIISNPTDNHVEQYQIRKMQGIINNLLGRLKEQERSRIFGLARKAKSVNDYRHDFGFPQLFKRALLGKSAAGMVPLRLTPEALATSPQYYSTPLDPYLAYADSFVGLDSAEAAESWHRRKTGRLLDLERPTNAESRAQKIKLDQASELSERIGSTTRVFEYAERRIDKAFIPQDLKVFDHMKDAENYLFENRPSAFRLFTNAKIPWDIQVFDSNAFEMEEAYRHFEPLTRGNTSFIAGEHLAGKDEALKLIINLSPIRPHLRTRLSICCVKGHPVVILKESIERHPEIIQELYSPEGNLLSSGNASTPTKSLALPEGILEAATALSSELPLCSVVFEVADGKTLLRSIDLGIQGGLFCSTSIGDADLNALLDNELTHALDTYY